MSLRVLHLCSEKVWRGGEQQTAYLVEELQPRGIENILVVRSGSPLEKYCLEKRLRFYTARFSNSFDVRSAILVKNICRMEKPDVIHLHTSKAHGIGVLASLLGNTVPMVLSRRVAFAPKNNFMSRWKYNYKSIKRILCVSNKITSIMQQYVQDPSRCVTVYSGIDLNKFKSVLPDRHWLATEFKIDDRKTIIVSVAALDDSKDHFTLIDTIEMLVKQGADVHALIVGDGPLKLTLKTYVSNKELDSHITFAGYRKDVPRILFSSDIFMITSKEEGLGTSILDAFLAKVPVVATDAGGIPEIVKHMDTGLLAPVKDTARLAEHIQLLLTDEFVRGMIVKQAFDWVQQFSKQMMSDKTLAVYQEVLRKKEYERV